MSAQVYEFIKRAVEKASLALYLFIVMSLINSIIH